MRENAVKGYLRVAGTLAIVIGGLKGTAAAQAATPDVDRVRAPATVRQPTCPLTGTWSLVAADKELPDGKRVPDYGAAPAGRFFVDAECRYSIQIFKRERPAFASGDKLTGTDAEVRQAVLGSSTLFGTVEVDRTAGLLLFKIEDASFPNWKGTLQKRSYTLVDDVLSYRVPPRPDGTIPISVWRRMR